MRRAVPAALALAAAWLAALTGCGGGPARPRTVTIKGSDTMVILGQRWADIYMQTHPGRVVQVTGGGSGTGIAALINGTTQIAQSSRPMQASEEEAVRRRTGAPVERHAVARDGITLFVNPANPVQELSQSQLRDIYTGAATRWSAFGGPDHVIVVYGRENSSGTYVFFKDHVLGGADFAPGVQALPGTAAVVDAVRKDPDGIGYGGFAYGRGVRHLKLAAGPGAPGVEPGPDTIRSGAYPLSRDLFWFTAAGAAPEVKALLEWVLSDAGQKVVTDTGYFPVRG